MSLRKAIDLALSAAYAEQFGGGYLKETSQLAAGIEGVCSGLARANCGFRAGKGFAEFPQELELTLDVPGFEILGSKWL